MIETPRLRMCHLSQRHRSAFARMHADAQVMADLGGPIDRPESDAKFDRYLAAQTQHGIARFALEDASGRFLGYCGIMPRLDQHHPLGPHHEIGWRLVRHVWGHGFATESAAAALRLASGVLGQEQVFSYTTADNKRSQRVMEKLGLIRAPECDFEIPRDDMRAWHCLVWKTRLA